MDATSYNPYPEPTADVDLSGGGHIHNWRTYIGENTARIWRTFTDEQRMALALDADRMASNEDWD